jgi:hypothetical protein
VFLDDDRPGDRRALTGALFTSLVVKKGQRIRERLASGIPVPVSLTEMSTVSRSRFVRAPMALPIGATDRVADGVRRVHHDVEHGLADLAAVTSHARDVTESAVDSRCICTRRGDGEGCSGWRG